ncbi:hypothetical protein [Parabacteroides pacaensis]|uniref:hypothetical protein n=1 Tax=Parabacteroides pacaensis TaxID=2086575 RepID=UPI000D1083C5|nr:hypothetical protein [Parabacteroides pacaensis]
MITTGDIATILVKDLKFFGIPTYKKGAIPEGKVLAERITVVPKEPKPGTYWRKGFAEVNFSVPNVDGMANTKRLTELERQASGLRSVSSFDGSTYRYSVYSTSQEEDTPLECHFVNVKIMFEVLNVR